VSSTHDPTDILRSIARITIRRPSVDPHRSGAVRAGRTRPVPINHGAGGPTTRSLTGPPHRPQITPRRGPQGAMPATQGFATITRPTDVTTRS
jgi:hypothetical protein